MLASRAALVNRSGSHNGSMNAPGRVREELAGPDVSRRRQTIDLRLAPDPGAGSSTEAGSSSYRTTPALRRRLSCSISLGQKHPHMLTVHPVRINGRNVMADLPMMMYNGHMQRVQVQLTDEQLKALRKHADATGGGVAATVRKAVDFWISNEERTYQLDRALEAIGGFHSGLGDLAERHDAYLDEDAT
jgi:hypothetical protein